MLFHLVYMFYLYLFIHFTFQITIHKNALSWCWVKKRGWSISARHMVSIATKNTSYHSDICFTRTYEFKNAAIFSKNSSTLFSRLG